MAYFDSKMLVICSMSELGLQVLCQIFGSAKAVSVQGDVLLMNEAMNTEISQVILINDQC